VILSRWFNDHIWKETVAGERTTQLNISYVLGLSPFKAKKIEILHKNTLAIFKEDKIYFIVYK